MIRVVAVLTGLAAVGCESGSCNFADCDSAAALTAPLPAVSGEYRIEIDDGDEVEVCALTLADPEPGAVVARCDDPALSERRHASVYFVMTNTDARWELELPSDPDRVTVRVLHNERLVASGTVTPTYEERRINGAGCGVTCRRGTGQISLK